jgi:hypothetical protein
MTDRWRRFAVERFVELIGLGLPRKAALLRVSDEISDRALGLTFSRASLYRWARRFSIEMK